MAGTQAIGSMLGGGAVTQTDTSSTGQSEVSSAFDSNAFLTMFMTQLKYQDPTNPMESYELASQLAQFSSVQKLTEATTLLQNLQSYSEAINNAQMASLVGKDVSGQTSTVEVKSDSVTSMNYRLDVPATGVTVTITDASGNTVYTENKGTQSAGEYEVAWDGKDSSGSKVSEGSYTVSVSGTDTSGTAVSATTLVHGTVASLNLDDTNPYYVLEGTAGTKVPVYNVFRVATPAVSTSQNDSTSTLSSILDLFG